MKVLLLLVSIFAVANADRLPPKLVWVGPGVYEGENNVPPFSLPPEVEDYPGITVRTSCQDDSFSCEVSYDVERTFFVTSPGDFIFSSSIASTTLGTNCSPNACFPEAILGIAFTGTSTILGSRTDWETLSDSGLTSAAVFTHVNLSAAQSKMTYLERGDYTLDLDFNQTVTMVTGDTGGFIQFDSQLTPVPESSSLRLSLLAVGGLLALKLRTLTPDRVSSRAALSSCKR